MCADVRFETTTAYRHTLNPNTYCTYCTSLAILACVAVMNRLHDEVRLTPNPAYGKEDRAFDGPEPARFMCPVTLQEMNGSHAFVVLMSTGWVMAEKATKEVGIAGLQVCAWHRV